MSLLQRRSGFVSGAIFPSNEIPLEIQSGIRCENPPLISLLVAVYVTDTVRVWSFQDRSLSRKQLKDTLAGGTKTRQKIMCCFPSRLDIKKKSEQRSRVTEGPPDCSVWLKSKKQFSRSLLANVPHSLKISVSDAVACDTFKVLSLVSEAALRACVPRHGQKAARAFISTICHFQLIVLSSEGWNTKKMRIINHLQSHIHVNLSPGLLSLSLTCIRRGRYIAFYLDQTLFHFGHIICRRAARSFIPLIVYV